MSLAAAAESLEGVLKGRDGFFVSTPPNGKVILVSVNEEAREDDRHLLRRLTRDGWEGWKVRIEGML